MLRARSSGSWLESEKDSLADIWVHHSPHTSYASRPAPYNSVQSYSTQSGSDPPRSEATRPSLLQHLAGEAEKPVRRRRRKQVISVVLIVAGLTIGIVVGSLMAKRGAKARSDAPSLASETTTTIIRADGVNTTVVLTMPSGQIVWTGNPKAPCAALKD